ncbi:hypothetical protein GQX73_g3257 [Xylaria multiplex]|uniref:Cyanovirin-N domain-containing protein n=1 Tax=Xylaria multiplex TaxID=323545 RepID=A0A7C8N0P1_9PEZI|nr:hypothetical protein GQX73_g3257 [Xylaria multiplex]
MLFVTPFTMGFLTLFAVACVVRAAPTIQDYQDTGGVIMNGTAYSFGDSCNTYSAYQSGTDIVLSASCHNKSGGFPYSSINLNHCITNNMGQMEARKDGNFGLSCNRMLFHGAQPILYGFCSNGKYPQEAAIDVGDFVDNDDGRLNCFGYYGE